MMLQTTVVIIISSLVFIGCASATNQHHEKHYQILLCNKLDGEIEYILEDRTRIDCLTDKYAVEVDFAKKWAESIGQSLYYSDMTGREPAVGLILGNNEHRFLKRLDRVAKNFNIKVFIIKKEE